MTQGYVCFRIRIPNRVERCQYNRGDFLHISTPVEVCTVSKKTKKQGSFK